MGGLNKDSWQFGPWWPWQPSRGWTDFGPLKEFSKDGGSENMSTGTAASACCNNPGSVHYKEPINPVWFFGGLFLSKILQRVFTFRVSPSETFRKDWILVRMIRKVFYKWLMERKKREDKKIMRWERKVSWLPADLPSTPPPSLSQRSS